MAPAAIEQKPLGEGRESVLDFLRGVFVILACWQHFAGISNQLDLPGSPTLCALFWMLQPAGDHGFLALAAFNLARRDRISFKTVYARKLYTFGVLFLLFLLESFVRAFDLASALTWGPLMTWMVVLSLLATVHRFFGPWGVLALFFVQSGLWLLPMPEMNDQMEVRVNLLLGLQGWRYESRIDLFLGSGCVGFLLGYVYYHFKSIGPWRLTGPAIVGSLLMALNWWIGPDYRVNAFDLFGNEYQVAETFVGILSIWGAIAVVLCSALTIDNSFITIKSRVLNWCGEHSLLIFALHLVLFMRVILPLRIHLGQLWDMPPRNNLVEVTIYTGIVIGVAWVIRKTRILSLLER